MCVLQPALGRTDRPVGREAQGRDGVQFESTPNPVHASPRMTLYMRPAELHHRAEDCNPRPRGLGSQLYHEPPSQPLTGCTAKMESGMSEPKGKIGDR